MGSYPALFYATVFCIFKPFFFLSSFLSTFNSSSAIVAVAYLQSLCNSFAGNAFSTIIFTIPISAC